MALHCFHGHKCPPPQLVTDNTCFQSQSLPPCLRATPSTDMRFLCTVQFLAKKQAAAITARAAAKAASRKLHMYLREVDEQHNIVRSHKRRRTGV